MALELKRRNSSQITLPKLRSGLTANQYKNAATMKATIYDESNVAVPTFTDVVFTYVPASQGDYVGRVTKEFNPEPGSYRLNITATQEGDDFERNFKVKVVEP